MLKKVMTLICFCCYLCFMQIGFAQDIIKQETPQKQTLKVAILPTLSSSQRYPDVNQLLYNNLTQEMHDCWNLYYLKFQKNHLHNHIGIWVLIIKMVVF